VLLPGSLPQELHIVNGDIKAVASLTILGLICPGLQAPFKVDLSAFGEVLIAGLCQLAERRAVEPFSIRVLHPHAVGVVVVRGYTERCNGLTCGRVTHSGVLSQILDNPNFIHTASPFLCHR
jgi:hypothetical protein